MPQEYCSKARLRRPLEAPIVCFLNYTGCKGLALPNQKLDRPQKALKPKVALFDTLLAEGALIAQSKFKNYFYINVAKNITKRCDCEMDSKGIISEDIGYFFGGDAVAIDKACLDAVIKLNGDIFKKFNYKTGIEQINTAQEFGMGKAQYKLFS